MVYRALLTFDEGYVMIASINVEEEERRNPRTTWKDFLSAVLPQHSLRKFLIIF